MIRIPRAAILGLAAMLLAGTAIAADEPDEKVPGRIAIIKNGILAKFVAKPPRPLTFTLPNASTMPTNEGAVLNIFDTAGSQGDTYNLPSGQWKALGNPPGSKGYK